jgi:regulator of CtrA degradation
MAAPFLVPTTARVDRLHAANNRILPLLLDTGAAQGHAFAVVRRKMSNRLIDGLQPVSFGERLAASQRFSCFFRDGMKLVEDTAAYLDGPGRQESKLLDRATSLAYATESMRLTTRLMHLASWLLLHRAVNEGEISLVQANKERTRIKLSIEEPTCPGRLAAGGKVGEMPALPAQLRDLIARSKMLKDQIRRLDATIHAQPLTAPADHNPFESQLGKLRAAFERRP